MANCIALTELEVSKSMWYVHHSHFYDQVTKTWLKDIHRTTEAADQGFDFSSSDETDMESDQIPHIKTSEGVMSQGIRLLHRREIL